MSLATPAPTVGPWRWLHDARYFQILFLGGFLTYGCWQLGWGDRWLGYLLLMGSCLLTQVVGAKLTHRPYSSWQSAVITALGLSLLCHSNHPLTLVLAGTLAIGSKFLIRYRGKHLFNPANLGIVAAILLTGDAWISPGQWGQEAVLLCFFCAAGAMVLLRVGRIDTSLTFLAVLGGCLMLRDVAFKGWPLDHWLHSLSSGALALFAFFMITDPVTTPNAPRARLIWAASIALLSFGLTAWFKVFDAPIWALFVSAPLTAWLDRRLPGERFRWGRSLPAAGDSPALVVAGSESPPSANRP
jgi:Na+-transporting NADH:ubiquinone oxidoreductase subunit NqrB